MIAVLCGTLIPIGYVAVAALTFGLAFFTLKQTSSYDPEGAAVGIAAFWPLGLPFFLVWRHVNELSTDGMSRKQRAQIAYLREKAELDEKALATQKEWERLLAADRKDLP